VWSSQPVIDDLRMPRWQREGVARAQRIANHTALRKPRHLMRLGTSLARIGEGHRRIEGQGADRGLEVDADPWRPAASADRPGPKHLIEPSACISTALRFRGSRNNRLDPAVDGEEQESGGAWVFIA